MSLTLSRSLCPLDWQVARQEYIGYVYVKHRRDDATGVSVCVSVPRHATATLCTARRRGARRTAPATGHPSHHRVGGLNSRGAQSTPDPTRPDPRVARRAPSVSDATCERRAHFRRVFPANLGIPIRSCAPIRSLVGYPDRCQIHSMPPLTHVTVRKYVAVRLKMPCHAHAQPVRQGRLSPLSLPHHVKSHAPGQRSRGAGEGTFASAPPCRPPR